MSRLALKTVVVGGVVYPAGAAVPDDVAELITSPGVLDEYVPAPEVVLKVDLTKAAEGMQAAAGAVEEIAATLPPLEVPEGTEAPSPAADPEESDDEDEDEDEPEPVDQPEPEPEQINYGPWTVDELKAEISTRNTYREATAQLSAAGKKADLVARLVADDQA